MLYEKTLFRSSLILLFQIQSLTVTHTSSCSKKSCMKAKRFSQASIFFEGSKRLLKRYGVFIFYWTMIIVRAWNVQSRSGKWKNVELETYTTVSISLYLPFKHFYKSAMVSQILLNNKAMKWQINVATVLSFNNLWHL